jgi:hypothetical protein
VLSFRVITISFFLLFVCCVCELLDEQMTDSGKAMGELSSQAINERIRNSLFVRAKGGTS